MIKVITRNLEDNSLECLTPVELATFRLIKMEKPERSLFCDLQKDFKDYVIGVDFDCLEYKDAHYKTGKEWLPSQCYFYIGLFRKHECYLRINGMDYHYCDILKNFGDILTIIANERTEELLKEITE